MSAFGSQAMSAQLRRVLMRRPGQSLIAADPAVWHYGPSFDGTRAIAQYAEFTRLVQKSGTEILWLDEADDESEEDDE